MSQHPYYEQLPRNSNPDYDLEGNQAYEMAHVPDNGYILDQCRGLREEATAISDKIQTLKILAAREDQENAQQDYERAAHDTIKEYRAIWSRFQTIRNMSQARESEANVRHINSTKRTLQAVLEEYNQAQQDIDKQTFQRKIRIINVARGANMSKDEVNEMANDSTQTNYFADALMKSDRRGQSEAALDYNRSRKKVSEAIVAQLMDIKEMNEKFADLVATQGPAIEAIAEKTGDTRDQVNHANSEIDEAKKSAKSRNKTKLYITLGIIIVLIIIAIIIAVVVTQNQKK